MAHVGRKTKLTAEVQQRICSAIEAGAYDWVAAEAAGICQRSFYTYLELGAEGRQPYAQFLQEVSRARAQARVAAEIDVRKDSPFNWLRYGPGKQRPGQPGWTELHEHVGEQGGPLVVKHVITFADRRKPDAA